MGSITPAIHVDKFSDYEKVYLRMSRAFKPLNKEHWGVHVVCTVEPGTNQTIQSIAPRLREAWKTLAVEYPGLTVVPEGFDKIFTPLTSSVLESWAEDTFTIATETADDIIAKAAPRDLPSLYLLTESSEVLFMSQHWRTDGLGCCILVDRLFQLVSSGDLSNEALLREPVLPSPCLEVAAGASQKEDAEIQAYARNHINNFHAKAVNAGGLPFDGDATRPPQCTKHADFTFSEEQTRRIVQACKIQSISVSAAVHTALARTYFDFNDSEAERAKGYTTLMAVNLRPYLEAPHNEKTHACQSYVTSITPKVSYESSFIDAAQDLTQQYTSWYSDKFIRSFYWLFRYHAEKLFAPPPPKTANSPLPKPPSGVTLSSLGVVEKVLQGQYGDALKVEKFRFGVSMMTRQTLLYAWTFRNELSLSLDYNEAYYSEQTASEIVGKVRIFLLKGLKLES